MSNSAGQREVSVFQLLLAIAAVAALVVGFLLVQGYKARWQRAQRVTVTVCKTRNAQTARLRQVEFADIELQKGLIEIETHNHFVDARTRRERVALYSMKLQKDEQFLAIKQPNCALLAP